MPAARYTASLFPVDFITGLSDGLILPLAACMIALPFAQERVLAPVVAGLAVGLAGACAFGWARYAGEREEIDHKHPQLGLEEAERELSLLKAIGIDDGLTESMKAEMARERELWLREVQEHELGWEQADDARARRGALHTATGFLTGAVLVSAPFLLVHTFSLSLAGPLCWALFCLLVTGWCKGRLTGRPKIITAIVGAARGLTIMTVAAAITWAVIQLQ